MMHAVEQVVMVVPVDRQHHERQHIGEKNRHERCECRRIGAVRDFHLEHHDGDDHGDHAVAERFEPSLAHVRYLRWLRKQSSAWSSTMPTACI